MEVKTITQNIEVHQYVANDGKVFEREDWCLAHERALQESRDYKTVENVPSFEYNEPYGSEDFRWYYIRSEEELMAVIRQDLCDEEISYSNYDSFPKIVNRYSDLADFPRWIVTITDENGYGGVYRAENALRWYEAFVDHVREEIQKQEALLHDKETTDRPND